MTEEAKRTAVALRHCFLYELDCKNCPSTDECDWHNGTMPLKAADIIESLSAQLDQVTRERDAAVEDMILGRICATCRHHNNSATSKCMGCLSWHSNWQWRGVEVEG